MSFSFTASGTPNDVVGTVGRNVASTPQIPPAFGDAINDQLSRLPTDASVSLTCFGHTGWGEAQTGGEISMHVTINVTAAKAPTPTSPEPTEDA